MKTLCAVGVVALVAPLLAVAPARAEVVSCGLAPPEHPKNPTWSKGFGFVAGGRGFGEHRLGFEAAEVTFGHGIGLLELQAEYALGLATVTANDLIPVDNGVFHRLGLSARLGVARVLPRKLLALDLEAGVGYQMLDLRRGGDAIVGIPDVVLGFVYELRFGHPNGRNKILRNWIGARVVASPYKEQQLTACRGGCPAPRDDDISWGFMVSWALAIGR